MRFFNWVQCVIVGLSGFVADVSSENKLKVDSRPAREFGAVSAFGLPKFALERRLVEYKFTNSLLQISFISSNTGNGATTTESPFIVNMTSGTTVSTTNTVTTKRPHNHPVAKGLIAKLFVQYSTVAQVGNRRCFGLYNDNEGFFVELGDTEIFFVTRKGGVDNKIATSTWDIPVSVNTNNNLWYIQSEGSGVGDFEIWYNEDLVHRISNLGVASDTYSNTTDLPLRIENTNDTNTTDAGIKIGGVLIAVEGEESVIVNDGQTDISINSSRRLNVQSGFSYLMDQKFDQAIDTVRLWQETSVGAGAFAQPANTFTLELSVGTGATDAILLNSKLTNLREGTGEFCVFEVGLSFGANNPTNHIKEWGYLDTSKLNGVFFRLIDGVFKFVTVKGGVEAVTDLNQAKPNTNFHNFRIEQLGAGKIIGIIINEAGKIVDFSPAAQSLVGSSEKQPFVRSYNVGVPASTPDILEAHWVRLLDLSGASIAVRGRDSDNVFRDARVTQAGNLAVSLEATPASDINAVEDSVQSGTVELSTLIPNLQTQVIKGLSGGTETSNSGAVVSLFIDPLGTGVEANYLLVDRIYVNGTTGSRNLSFSVTGDGTKEVVLQRRQFGGGSFLTTATYAADII